MKSEPVLAISDLDKKNKNRSRYVQLDYVTGGVLSMEYEDSWWQLVAYLLKFLDETERSYEIYNKEILAVIRD